LPSETFEWQSSLQSFCYLPGKAISDALVQLIEVDIPETMLTREIDFLLNQQAVQLKNYGIDINQLFTEEFLLIEIPSEPAKKGKNWLLSLFFLYFKKIFARLFFTITVSRAFLFCSFIKI
jgi:hypothetical protein